jgi:hypothetical protein
MLHVTADVAALNCAADSRADELTSAAIARRDTPIGQTDQARASTTRRHRQRPQFTFGG